MNNRLASCLLTNDDGDTELLRLTLEMARPLVSEITVVIPLVNQTGCASAITMNKEIHLEHVAEYSCDGTEWWTVSKYPADGVRFGLRQICQNAELVISGLNDGHNLGFSVINSGTVGAAMEGARFGVSAICLSAPYAMPKATPEWIGSVQGVMKRLLNFEPLREYGPAILNVNFPSDFAEDPAQLKVLPVSKVQYEEWYEKAPGRGNVVFLRGERMLADELVPDLQELESGHVVVNVIDTPWTKHAEDLHRLIKEQLR